VAVLTERMANSRVDVHSEEGFRLNFLHPSWNTKAGGLPNGEPSVAGATVRRDAEAPRQGAVKGAPRTFSANH
jgi:hypothetical protein